MQITSESLGVFAVFVFGPIILYVRYISFARAGVKKDKLLLKILNPFYFEKPKKPEVFSKKERLGIFVFAAPVVAWFILFELSRRPI